MEVDDEEDEAEEPEEEQEQQGAAGPSGSKSRSQAKPQAARARKAQGRKPNVEAFAAAEMGVNEKGEKQITLFALEVCGGIGGLSHMCQVRGGGGGLGAIGEVRVAGGRWVDEASASEGELRAPPPCGTTFNSCLCICAFAPRRSPGGRWTS